MEVKPPSKQLHKHAAPIVMIALGLLALPAIMFSHYNSTSLPAEGILARGLVTHVLRVQPTPNGLAKITLDSSSTANTIGSNVDSSLGSGLAQTGRTAQLSIYLSGAGGESRTPVTSLEN